MFDKIYQILLKKKSGIIKGSFWKEIIAWRASVTDWSCRKFQHSPLFAESTLVE